jgi:formimidoylglutamase
VRRFEEFRVIPHTKPAALPPTTSSRFASLIRRNPGGCAVALLGLADDLGVRLNSGRPGADRGPCAFREALARYGVADPAGWSWPAVFDAGDIVPAEGDSEEALHTTHARITQAVEQIVSLGLLPVGIGGGHDLTFPFVRGVISGLKSGGRISGPPDGVYFDAHLDVRETVGSGMPFRRLIKECGVSALSVRGLNELANSLEHVQWFQARGGRIEPGETLPPPHALRRSNGLFVSMDLDVLDASHAPGVSALNPAGWNVHSLSAWALQAGQSSDVFCFDIMELNPVHDVDGRTSRIAAHLFLSFLRGFASRNIP